VGMIDRALLGNRFFISCNKRRRFQMNILRIQRSPSIIIIMKSRRMRLAGHVARMGEKRNAYRLLVGKPEGKRPLGRPRHRLWIILGWMG
jgi:hypothetical protein